jgi:hypothetical protein
MGRGLRSVAAAQTLQAFVFDESDVAATAADGAK